MQKIGESLKKFSFAINDSSGNLLVFLFTFTYFTFSLNFFVFSESLQTLVQQKESAFLTDAQYAQEALKKGSECLAKKDYQSAFGWYQSALDFLPAGGSATAKMRRAGLRGFEKATLAWAQQKIAAGGFQDASAMLEILLQDRYSPHHSKALTLFQKLKGDQYFNKTFNPDFFSQSQKVKQLLREAEGFYESRQYDLAFLRYEQILHLDPYHTPAREGQQKVERARLDYEEEAYNERRAEMTADVQAAWELPIQKSDKEDISSPGERPETQALAAMEKKLDQIIIPQVNFRDTPLREALQYLRQRAVVLDATETDPSRKGINIILKSPPESDQANIPITLQLTDVPLRNVLLYLMEGANMKLKVDPHAVLAVPLSEVTEAFLTKEYPVSPSFISELPGGGGEEAPLRAEFVEAGGGTVLAAGSRPAIVTRSGAKEFLEAHGITFPAGASANYLPSSSRLVVKNTPANIDLIDALVEQTSRVEKQVRIEAKFLEITQNNAEELGFDWLLGQFRLPFGSGVFGNGGSSRSGTPSLAPSLQNFPIRNEEGRTSVGSSPNGAGHLTTGNRSGKLAIQLNALDALFSGGNAAFGGAVVTPGVLALAGIFTDPQFQLVIRALHQKKGVDLMTAPSVTTKSGHAARIQIVREFRYPTQFDPPQVPPTQTFGISPLTPTTPSAFATKNTGIELDVTPTVGPDGETIDLILQPRVTEFEGFINYGSQIDTVAPITSALGLATGATATVKLSDNTIHQPVFSIREAHTQVTITDGFTVALGGLIQEKIQKVRDKIPFLGDIPGVGQLFRSEVERRVKANLILFVTAHLIDPSGGELGSFHKIKPPVPETRRAQLATEM